MDSGLLLNVVVSNSASVIKLLACKDEALLICWDTLASVNLGLHALDGLSGLNVNGDGLASKCLDEHLHGTTAETEN